MRGPAWLREPGDVNALVAATLGGDGAARSTVRCGSAASTCATWPRSSAPRRTSSTRPTCGPAPAPSARRSPAWRRLLRRQGVPVHRGRPLDRRGGARPRHLHRRRARRRPARRRPDRRESACTATTRATPRSSARSASGVGRIIVDSFDEIDRVAASPRELGASRPRAGAGHRRRRGPHPRVHRDRPRGPEVRLLAQPAAHALEAVDACSHEPVARPARPALPHRLARSSTPPASRSRRAGVLGLHAAAVRDELGVELPELDLGGGFGIAYTTQDDPADAAQLADGLAEIVARECAALGVAGAAALGRARPGDRRAGDVHGLRRSAPSRWSSSTAARSRTYVSVDGGMSDNIRTALYDADYSCTLAYRASDAPPPCCRGSSASTARAATSWSRTSSCPVTSRAGDLVAVPAHGRLLPVAWPANYNHVAAAAGRRRADGRRDVARPPRDRGRPARASTSGTTWEHDRAADDRSRR